MKITAPVTDYIRASVMSVLGDLVVRGVGVPERFPAGASGQVLTGRGAGTKPFYKSLFNLLTTQGDLLISGETLPQRLAAGALDTYFKGQGAGALPIYEKLALRDTGIKIALSYRNTAGDQVITGVGFRPSLVIFLVSDAISTHKAFSVGFDDGTVHCCIYFLETGNEIARSVSRSLLNRKDISNMHVGYITAVSDDGFTITWTLTGTRDTEFIYLCFP